MKFLFMYLGKRKKSLLVFFLFVIIFGGVFFLYSLPLKAVLYPMLICVIIGGIILFLDYKKAYSKHKRLTEIEKLNSALMERFPALETQDDIDYQNIIESLREEIKELETKADIRYQDTVDYYTTWVHQIKTPIASMRLTLQNEDSDTARQISEDLFRIEQYVEMVLTFLRMGSDSTDYMFREYDLDEIVKGCVKKFASQFIRKKIKLQYEPLNVKVLTDEKWLAFVIEQLLSNAVKYTPSEGKVTIDLENEKTLCIRDTGIGIASEDLPRIFEKGYTGYNGRSDKKASGLGLYLCKCICDNLGNSITADSSPDMGTVIRINLNKEELKTE